MNKSILILIAVVCVVILFIWVLVGGIKVVKFFNFKGLLGEDKVLLTAHRGLSSKYPENTLIAFEKALGCSDILEFDVRFTKDKVLVIMHDESVNRTTNGRGRVSDLTLEEIKKLDAGRWFDKEFKGEMVPTLQEVFEKFGKKTRLAVEIKEFKDKKLCLFMAEECVRLAEKYDLENNVLFISFDHDVLKKIKEIKPSVNICLLFGLRKVSKDLIKQNKLVDYINQYGGEGAFLNKKLAKKSLIDDLKKHGLIVGIYTIDEASGAKRQVGLGVDMICSNKPDYLKRILLEE